MTADTCRTGGEPDAGLRTRPSAWSEFANSPAAAVRDWLSGVAARLCVADPAPVLGLLLDRTFGRPRGDRDCAANTLALGAAPLELSFSEREPTALRLDLEPFEPGLSPAERRAETVEVTAATLRSSFGAEAAELFGKASAPWLAPAARAERFGAFYGAAFDADGPAEATLYLELPRDDGWMPPGAGPGLLDTVCAHLPAAAPLMHAISCNRAGLAELTSFAYLDELRLLDLAPLFGALGLAHRAPALLDAALALTGGLFALPAGTVVLGLRRTAAGIELKLELLLACLPVDAWGAVERLLAARPALTAAFRRWRMAMGEGGKDGCARPGVVNVVSARTGPEGGVELNVYVRPASLARPCGTGAGA